MKLTDIHIRDPYILPFEGKYYLYGRKTAGKTPTTPEGFVVYVSPDLDDWSEPVDIFSYYDGFWGTQDYWAPEVHPYNGKFYLFASFKSDTACRGTQIFAADSPMGPFVPHSDGAITPRNWECLDGTLYVENGVPYMIFCHEWVQIQDGEMCIMQLSQDLKTAVSAPAVLFRASEPEWAHGVMENCFVTDGPFLHKDSAGNLLILWSSFDKNGYVEAIAAATSGSVHGPWQHCKKLLIDTNGGHGMLFRDHGGQLYFVMHAPNHPGGAERARLMPVEEIPQDPFLQLANP